MRAYIFIVLNFFILNFINFNLYAAALSPAVMASLNSRSSPFGVPNSPDGPDGAHQNISESLNLNKISPLVFELICLKNTQAQQVVSLIKQDPALISPGGGIGFDERTNTLLISNSPENLLEIKKLINLIDVPVAQILIQARVVEVEKSALEELGVTQGIGDSGEPTPNMVIGNNNLSKSGVAAGAIGQLINPINNPAGILGLSLQKLPGGLLLDLQLQALESEGKAQVISAPKLTVLNDQEAVIQQGSEVPYLSAALNGATQVQFKKAVLSLRVRPEVTADHEILMSLQVNKDKVSTISAHAQGTPVIDTREINTSVKVKNGETLVLGGIEESIDSESERGIPVLDKMPGIGWLFRSKNNRHEESEMLIFITPVIEEN